MIIKKFSPLPEWYYKERELPYPEGPELVRVWKVSLGWRIIQAWALMVGFLAGAFIF